MIVYKFGGASVKDAEGVKNLSSIVNPVDDDLVVVVSAMGKTTNAMERIADAYFTGDKEGCLSLFVEVKAGHQKVMDDLFGKSSVYQEGIDVWFNLLQKKLDENSSSDFDFEYDQIVPFGEMLSTYIVNSYLNHIGVDSDWLDVRTVLKTNNQYREAETDWTLTEQLMKKYVTFTSKRVCVTQGFVGGTTDGLSTTLGREGSDYTAAVFGYIFNAGYVTIWKDVPGILNADPRWYPSPQKIDEISYREAIELAFYGAQVIHPKTIKPLENKRIPLFVKSFFDPLASGTKIYKLKGHVELPPVYIIKKDQLLLTISPKDFSFIVEDSLSEIFMVFSRNRVKINLMHNSAINFSVCVDSMDSLDGLLNELSEKYVVKYNDDLELVSIRHYTDEASKTILEGKEVIDSQVSRNTARYVVRRSEWRF
jgi:aspartate kinase